MSLTGTTIYLHNFKRPLAQRKQDRKRVGPYMHEVLAPGAREGFGFYFQSRALKMGTGADLRVLEPAPYGRARITGYYADEYGDSLIKPYVFRLPHGRGFLAGCGEGEGMWGSFSRTIHDSEEEAGYAAHTEAERAAERERAFREEEDARLREEEEEDADLCCVD